MSYRRYDKKDYTLIIIAVVGVSLGITFGYLGTVSKEKFYEYDKERKVILESIKEQESKIEYNNNLLIELEEKEKELIKSKEELLEKERKMNEEQKANISPNSGSNPSTTN